MKNLVLIIATLLCMQACDGQINKTNNTIEMEKFNINKFEENKGKQGYDNEYVFRTHDDFDVREFATIISNDAKELQYQREVSKEFSPFKNIYVYYNNGNLYAHGEFFNSSPNGISKEYDKNGKLIKETNFDKNFKHTFEQIHNIVLKEKKIDIYDTRQAIALRHDGSIADNIKPYYQIHVVKSELVDGIWYSQPDYSFILDDATLKEISSKDKKDK